MPQKGTSPTARLVAVGGLIVVFLAAIGLIATSGGGGDGDAEREVITVQEGESPDVTSGDSDTRGDGRQDPDVAKAIEKGEYTVKEGDTMTSIAEATGVEADTLQELNPEVDAQILPPGTKLKLR